MLIANPYTQQYAMTQDDEVEGRFLADVSMDVGDRYPTIYLLVNYLQKQFMVYHLLVF